MFYSLTGSYFVVDGVELDRTHIWWNLAISYVLCGTGTLSLIPFMTDPDGAVEEWRVSSLLPSELDPCCLHGRD